MHAVRLLKYAGAMGLSFFSSALASADFWTPPTQSYQITAQTPAGVAQTSGQSAQITGLIQAVGGTPCSGKTVLDSFSKSSIQIRAFFPDATHEVTSSLGIATASDAVHFTYATPNLVATDANVLTVQVSHLSPETLELMKVQAKLNRRALDLEQRIASLKKKGAKGFELQAFQAELSGLQDLHQPYH